MSQQPSSDVPSDYTSSLLRAKFLSTLKPGAHIHIAGICGTGMAAVATLLKDLGFQISGSDKAFYPPMGDEVKKLGVKLFEGYSADNLFDPVTHQRPDVVIIGNSLSRGNPEVEKILESKIPFASMPEVFQSLLIGSHQHCGNSVVITGTHGKTTTSAATAVMLDLAGWEPGYFVGGVLNDLPGNIRATSTSRPAQKRVVVLEGDEYDSAFFAKWPKFHSYRPDLLVVTSLEFDHGDIYESIEQIEAEFTRLVISVPSTGSIFVCAEGKQLARAMRAWRNSDTLMAKLYSYGTPDDCDFRLVSREILKSTTGGLESSAQVLHFQLQEMKLEVTTSLTGLHNAHNLLAAAAVGKTLGLSAAEIQLGLAGFHGVMRRQQVLAEISGITVIEDFAHHPTAVDVTLRGIKERYPERRLVAVYEPRSNTSRRAFFQAEYAKAFAVAELTIIKEVKDAGGYSGVKAAAVALDVPELIRQIRDNVRVGGPADAHSFAEINEISDFLLTNLTAGDVVVLMSNGDFGGLMNLLVKRLKERYPTG